MKTKRPLLWLIPLILLLLLIPFIVPSSLPGAGAEENLPKYEPVELTNRDPGPVPTEEVKWQGKKTREKVLYNAHEDAFYSHDDGTYGYLDGTISVKMEERVINDTRVIFTWVQISDPSQLRAQFTAPYPSASAQYANKLAEREQAVVTLNGDYCVGIKQGFVWRNGIEFRSKEAARYDQLIIDKQGDFHILKKPCTAADLEAYQGNILHSFIFGPALVVDSVLQDIGEARDYGSSMNFKVRAQRQVFCQMGPLSYLIVTTEGPEQAKKGKEGGFSMYDMAQLVYDCGAVNAYNMDGGSSTWLTLGTRRISNSNGRQLRKITDIVYFVTAEPDASGKAK